MFNVSLEINVMAESPFLAAVEARAIINETKGQMQYFVQNDETKELYSIDYQVECQDSILVKVDLNDYKPVIKK